MFKKVKYMINYLIKADIVFVNSEDTYDLAKKKQCFLLIQSWTYTHETLGRNTETKMSLIGQ